MPEGKGYKLKAPTTASVKVTMSGPKVTQVASAMNNSKITNSRNSRIWNIKM
jgi:hypothetical protein